MILVYFIIPANLHMVCVTGSSAIKLESDIYIPIILGYNYISDSSFIAFLLAVCSDVIN